MRLPVFVVAALLTLGLPALAQPYQSPEALLKAFYKPYLANELPEGEERFRSAALNALYEADAENTPDGEMGALEFDPYIDGQDWLLDDFSIGEPEITEDWASVDVSFTNMGEPRLITFDLVFEDGGWLIDDVSGGGDEYPYRLSEIFEEASAN